MQATGHLALGILAACVAACSIDRDGLLPPGDAGRRDSGPDAGPRDAPFDVPMPDSPIDGPLEDRPDVDAGCTAGETTCSGGVEMRCEDGVPVPIACALGCATSAPRCASLLPANVGAIFDDAAPDVLVNRRETLETGVCSETFGSFLLAMQGDGSTVCLLRAGRFEVAAAGELVVVGPHPLVVLATEGVSVAGEIDLGARELTPGGGGAAPGAGLRPGADGTSAGGSVDGGGGGGGLCSSGGVGGAGGAAAGGPGGAPVLGMGLRPFSPLQGGSGGGAGNGGAADVASGGAGGGALQISSLGEITIDGTIEVGGGGGRGGGATSGDPAAGGGGGSGGTILLEAPTVTFGPSAVLRAAGGSGGGGAGDPGPVGGNGRNGAAQLGRTPAGTGSGADGGDGGRGGGGDDPTGGDGVSMTTPNANGGGGGGSSGCVLIRNATGVLPSLMSNPTVGPAIAAAVIEHD